MEKLESPTHFGYKKNFETFSNFIYNDVVDTSFPKRVNFDGYATGMCARCASARFCAYFFFLILCNQIREERDQKCARSKRCTQSVSDCVWNKISPMCAH